MIPFSGRCLDEWNGAMGYFMMTPIESTVMRRWLFLILEVLGFFFSLLIFMCLSSLVA
jgi:hypothetical protein